MPRSNSLRRYVAFLRGINVGGHRVKMDQLRELLEGLKLNNVSTFIASGNVIFDSTAADTAALERQVEAHLQQALGDAVDTFIRTPDQLATVAAFRPFAAEDIDAAGHTLHIGFLREAHGDEAGRTLSMFRSPVDDFHVHGSELYWLCRGKLTESKVAWPRLEKTVAITSTLRNVTTIRKLVAKSPPG
jgi:uncharacterized protein (DUF1697 family)